MGVYESGEHQHPLSFHDFLWLPNMHHSGTVELFSGAHWTLGCGQHQMATWFDPFEHIFGVSCNVQNQSSHPIGFFLLLMFD